MLSDRMMQAAHPKVAGPGQQAYTSAGTYTFTVPAGITSISAVCIGGGGGGSDGDQVGLVAFGGDGGSLSYKNSMSVTPGQSVTVVVGPPGDTGFSQGPIGSDSSITISSVVEVRAKGGGSSSSNVGDVSYVGGAGSAFGGGGGAAGYAGNGGAGGSSAGSNGSDAAASSGGGGGGASNVQTQNYPNSGDDIYGGGGGGGGVGLLGLGATGSGGVYQTTSSDPFAGPLAEGGVTGSGANWGGNGWTDLSGFFFGGPGQGGAFGGGQGGAGYNFVNGRTVSFGASGGVGAVRIIWGAGRSYPSNAANV
jgi:hypothetical protein